MRRPGFAALWLASLAAMLRDKGAALLLLGAPVLYGFFYPWFYAPQVVQRVPVALVVQDASGLSRQMLRFAQASPRIDPRLVTADEGLARAALMRGEVQGYALIAPDFKRDVVRGAAVVVPVYANGAYPLAAKQVQYGFAEAFGTVSAGVEIKRLQAGGQSAQQAAASRSPVNLQAVALFNPTEGYGSFVVAAVALLILQQTLLMGGALLVGAAVANGLAFGLNLPVIPVHHLEGHLLSPMLADPAPTFPFVALLVSGGHTQLMAVRGVGDYETLGETLDDAAGEAFDKTAKLLGLPYPGGPELSRLAEHGDPTRFTLPRPMLRSGDFDMSFSGLKTAVLTLVRQQEAECGGALDDATRADICRAFQEAIVEVLVSKSLAALKATGMQRLVIAGGVGANRQLRAALDRAAQRRRFAVYYPPLSLCTDNGAMIAYAGAARLALAQPAGVFSVRPRWPLASLAPVSSSPRSTDSGLSS